MTTPRFGWQVGIRLAGCASLLLPGLVLALLLPGGITLELDAQTAQLVSLPDPSQNPAAGGGVDSLVPSLSPDGRYVLFSSAAGNLLNNASSSSRPGPVPVQNVFLRDRSNATTTLVSINLPDNVGGNGDSVPVAVSTNGRYALFESSASDLVPGDTNGVNDVFLRDLVAGTTLLVSACANNGPADGASWSSVMTPDGRYVAFVSAADNLVPGDTNGIPDVFVRDMQTGRTTLASVGTTPAGSAGFPTSSSEAPDITPDGRYVVFYSSAGNLVPGMSGTGDIFVRDLAAGTTSWISAGASPVVAGAMGATNAVSYNHAISADGQFIAYESSPWFSTSAAPAGVILRYSLLTGTTDVINTNATVPTAVYQDARSLAMTPDGRFVAFVGNASGTLGTNTCIYVWDAQSGTTTLASGDLSNAVPPNSTCDWPALDNSGRFVVFLSNATNLVANTLAGDLHLYLRDLLSATTTLVDADTNGLGAGVSLATIPRLSADGRLVAFESAGLNLVPDDRNRSYDVFVRDTAAALTELISVRDPTLPCLTPNGPGTFSPLCLSADGRYLAFASEADNLVPGDTNGGSDVFVRDLVTSTNILVSVSTNGASSGDGASTDPAISSDGRYVVFTSSADNLVAGDTNKARDVFVRDLQAGTTILASLGTNGVSPGSGDSYLPMIGANNRFLFFHSKATNLARATFSGTENLFMRDLQARTNTALTTGGLYSSTMTPNRLYLSFSASSTSMTVQDAQAGTQLSTFSVGTSASSAQASPDGKWIVWSQAGSLYARYRTAGTNFIVSPQCPASHAGLRFSADSRFLAHATIAAQSPTDTNGVSDIYLYDFQNRTNLLISLSCASPGAPNGPSDSPDISADGRFVAYRSSASDIVPGDTNGLSDVFLYDRTNGITTLLSVNRFGTSSGNNKSFAPLFSRNGGILIFQSAASDLTSGDFNNGNDIFSFALSTSAPIPLFSAEISVGATPAQGPWISWPVLPGKTYRVQFKNDLNDSAWQNLAGGISVVGNQGYFNDFAPAADRRFYRIVAH
jgi:Tol biopolymer transport system component